MSLLFEVLWEAKVETFEERGTIIPFLHLPKDVQTLRGPRHSRKEMLFMTKVKLDTFLLETATDNNGFFTVQHKLEQFQPDGYRIRGIIVAVQHHNLNWHTLEFSNSVDNRFWWNERVVEGVIGSPNFSNRPVQVVVFAQFIVG
jgi:hypothetical protein